MRSAAASPAAARALLPASPIPDEVQAPGVPLGSLGRAGLTLDPGSEQDLDSFDLRGAQGAGVLRINAAPPFPQGTPGKWKRTLLPAPPSPLAAQSWEGPPWPRGGGASPSRQPWGALVTPAAPEPLWGGGLPSQRDPQPPGGYPWVLLGAPPWPEGRG